MLETVEAVILAGILVPLLRKRGRCAPPTGRRNLRRDYRDYRDYLRSPY